MDDTCAGYGAPFHQSSECLSSQWIALLERFAESPLEEACTEGVAALQLHSLDTWGDAAGNKAVFLHQWALGRVSPERYWVLHVSGLLPFEAYIDNIELHLLIKSICKMRENETDAVQLIREDILFFIFRLSRCSDADAEQKVHPLLRRKCAWTMSCIMTPSMTSFGLLPNSGPLITLHCCDVESFYNALRTIGKRIGPKDISLTASFTQFQIEELSRWMKFLVEFPDSNIEEIEGNLACFIRLHHKLVQELRPDVIERTFELLLTIESSTSIFDYRVHDNLLQHVTLSQILAIKYFLLDACQLSPAGRLVEALKASSTSRAIIAITEKHSELFLRCLCLTDILSTVNFVCNHLNEGVCDWMDSVFDRFSPSCSEVHSHADDTRLSKESTQSETLLFICRSLIGAITHQSDRTLRALCKWLRGNREINRSAVDEFMQSARYKLRDAEKCSAFISAYSNSSPDEGTLLGPELNADRVESWAKIIENANSLPPAVFQFCSFNGNQGYRHIISKITQLFQDGKCNYNSCHKIVSRMCQSDLCPPDVISQFETACMRNEKVRGVIGGVMKGLSGDLQPILSGICEVVYALIESGSQGELPMSSFDWNVLYQRWKEAFCSMAMACFATKYLVEPMWLIRAISALVILLGELCCTICLKNRGFACEGDVTNTLFLRCWKNTIMQLCSVFSGDAVKKVVSNCLFTLFLQQGKRIDPATKLSVENSLENTGVSLLLICQPESVLSEVVSAFVFYLSSPGGCKENHIHMLLTLEWAIEINENVKNESTQLKKRTYAESLGHSLDADAAINSEGADKYLKLSFIWLYELFSNILGNGMIKDILPDSMRNKIHTLLYHLCSTTEPRQLIPVITEGGLNYLEALIESNSTYIFLIFRWGFRCVVIDYCESETIEGPFVCCWRYLWRRSILVTALKHNMSESSKPESRSIVGRIMMVVFKGIEQALVSCLYCYKEEPLKEEKLRVFLKLVALELLSIITLHDFDLIFPIWLEYVLQKHDTTGYFKILSQQSICRTMLVLLMEMVHLNLAKETHQETNYSFWTLLISTLDVRTPFSRIVDTINYYIPVVTLQDSGAYFSTPAVYLTAAVVSHCTPLELRARSDYKPQTSSSCMSGGHWIIDIEYFHKSERLLGTDSESINLILRDVEFLMNFPGQPFEKLHLLGHFLPDCTVSSSESTIYVIGIINRLRVLGIAITRLMLLTQHFKPNVSPFSYLKPIIACISQSFTVKIQIYLPQFPRDIFCICDLLSTELCSACISACCLYSSVPLVADVGGGYSLNEKCDSLRDSLLTDCVSFLRDNRFTVSSLRLNSLYWVSMLQTHLINCVPELVFRRCARVLFWNLRDKQECISEKDKLSWESHISEKDS